MVYQFVAKVAREMAEKASEKPIQAAGLITVVAVLAAGWMLPSFYAKSASHDDLAPALTESETKKIMAEILNRVSIHAAKIANAVEGIRQQLASRGQTLDANFMKTQILPHFVTGLQEAQTAVLQKFNADESELEDAVTTYIDEGDDEIEEMANKIKKIYNEFGGDADIDDGDEEEIDESEELSLSDAIKCMATLSTLITEQTDKYIEEYKSQYGLPLDNQSMAEFQNGLLMLTTETEKNAMKEMGISTKQFQTALEKHGNHQSMQQAFMMMQMQTQKVYQKHGLQMLS